MCDTALGTARSIRLLMITMRWWRRLLLARWWWMAMMRRLQWWHIVHIAISLAIDDHTAITAAGGMLFLHIVVAIDCDFVCESKLIRLALAPRVTHTNTHMSARYRRIVGPKQHKWDNKKKQHIVICSLKEKKSVILLSLYFGASGCPQTINLCAPIESELFFLIPTLAHNTTH